MNLNRLDYVSFCATKRNQVIPYCQKTIGSRILEPLPDTNMISLFLKSKALQMQFDLV